VNNAVFNVRRKSPTLHDGSQRSSDSAFQVVSPNREGPATECASSVAAAQSSDVDWWSVNILNWRHCRPESSSQPDISVLGSADIGAT